MDVRLVQVGVFAEKTQDTAFSGEGGLYAPARWTPQGFRAVYTAESLSLASLEVFVHTESNKIL